jgi:magnesium-transporting ATPase (P-type)
MTFNLLFNSLPPLIQGIADQNLEATTLMRHSHLYQQGVKNEVYLPRSFWLFWLMGCYQSLVAFWIVFASYYDDGIDYLSLGWVTTTIVLASNLISQGIEYKTWTVFHWASNIGSFIVYIVFSYFYCEVKLLIPVFVPSSYGIFDNLFGLGQFWLTCLLGTVLCVLPHLAIRAVQSDLFPTKSQAARLEERKQKPVEPSVLRNCFW